MEQAYPDDVLDATSDQTIVLIVDANQDNIELLQLLCEACECTVITAGDGQTALQLVEQYSLSLIFVELMLPILDGVSVVRTLRQQGNLVPVIAMTTLSEPQFREAALLAGCNEFFQKPFDIEIIQTVIAHYLYQLTSPA